VLGLYYGGTGVGIIASAALVPLLAESARAHAWQSAWWALGAAALLCTALTARTTGALAAPPPVRGAAAQPFRWRPLGFGLAAYFLFGLGYIGYMTFIVTLLREQQVPSGQIVAFYALIGLGVMASSWLWARLLQRARGGGALATLNMLAALATALPVLSVHPLAVIVSGAMFGSVFLSVVASTTAMVRHNLAPPVWAAGIAAFTIVFAAGQIVGPSLIGWLADGPGGLARGFLWSAAFLAGAALLAARQKPL
jgi:predicted MFS family arabinose efflux permease